MATQPKRALADDALDIVLQEYESVSDDIRTQIGFQTQTFGWLASGVGLFAGLALGREGRLSDPTLMLALLGIAVLSSVFGMFMIDKDLFVLAHIKYLECVVKPRLSEQAGVEVLGLHHFKHHWLYGGAALRPKGLLARVKRRPGDRRPRERKLAMLLTGPFPHALFVLLSWSATGLLVYFRLFAKPEALEPLQWFVVIAIAAFCSLYLFLGVVLVGRQWGKLGSCSDDECATDEAQPPLVAVK